MHDAAPRALWASRLGFILAAAGWVYPSRHFLIRYVSPPAVAVVLYFKAKETGLFDWLLALLQ